MKKIVIMILALFVFNLLVGNVHTSYLWHLQQPIYWPEQSTWNSNGYQFAWESQYLKDHNGNWYSDGQQHPSNNLNDIFGLDDRKSAYQYRPHDSVQTLLNLPDAGAQISYSGCLMQNVNSLADAGQWGYYTDWQNSFREARNWTTSAGKPRMDIVGFTMHHALSPLVDENCLKKQIETHKYIYELNFGSSPNYSKGFWPAECAFSERIIKVLAQEGFEWTIIANSHLARTLADYPINYGTSGCNIDPPNPADIVQTNGTNWWNGNIDGRGGTFAAPYCYQAHKAKYVEPNTGEEFTIDVVPMADLLSYENGYGTMNTSEIDNYIAPFDDPNHPSIVLMAHDGDNAWGGGYSYYMESVPNFANVCANQGYTPTTIQQFLYDNPVPASNIVHVEDGSWVNAANDWGHPQFINWLWPMYDSNYNFDPNGWTEDARNWAVLTAAENRVETAENLTGTLNIAQIVAPNNLANAAEKAWHFLLPAYTSGYMYYGTSGDMEVKPSLACNKATDYADTVINGISSSDNTPPTIFIPQRFPYNPGGKGFGPIYGYQEHQNSSDFYIWTFAYDVSGLSSVILKYRLDANGVNPLSNNENETYSGGSEVGSWNSINMNERDFPTDNVTGNPDVDFFIMPNYIADEYYAQINGLSDVLVDYYVEATDNFGNAKKSPIQHVYVGNYTPGGGGENTVSWSPEEPLAGDDVTIFYGEDSPLFSSTELYIHLATNGWGNVTDYPMTFDSQTNKWKYIFATSQQTCSINFVFTDGDGNWDNNNGSDWEINVANCSTQDLFIMDGILDESSQALGTSGESFLNAGWDGTKLYLATNTAQSLGKDIFIFVANSPSSLINAPWSKSGSVGNWDAYLASESTNNWNGWFDNLSTAESISGNILEGTINLQEELGNIPTELYIALGTYGTNDSDSLVIQLPNGNGNIDIDLDEFYLYSLDQQFNAPQNVRIYTSADSVQIIWDHVENASYYKIYSSDKPFANFVEMVSSIADTMWTAPINTQKKFYYIKAVKLVRNRYK